MKRLSRWFWQIWFELRKRVFGKQIPLRTAYVAEFPDELDKDYLYLIGENEHIWFTAPLNCVSIVLTILAILIAFNIVSHFITSILILIGGL